MQYGIGQHDWTNPFETGNTGSTQPGTTPDTPPPPPKPPVPTLPRFSKGFFGVAAASLLYLLSAFSILWGMAKLIGPVLAESGMLRETLPCIAALNLYELALLGVLLAIVLLRKASGDAVSLTALAALFLAATGIALDTVANDSPPAAAVVAIGCLVLALAKLLALKKYAMPPLGGALLGGLGLLAAWNFFTAPAMAALLQYASADAMALRTAWLAAWYVMLTAAVLMLVRAVRTPAGAAVQPDKTAPFLGTHGMAWVFAGLLLAGGAIHQYALTYMFDVPWTFGDYVPLIAIGALIVVELLRAYGVKRPELDVAIALIPLWLLVMLTFSKDFALAHSRAVIGFLWRPPVLAAMMACATAGLSLKAGRRRLLWVALTYALACVLGSKGLPGRPLTLNWSAFGATLLVVLLVLGLVRRQPWFFMAAVLLAAIGMWQSDFVAATASAWRFSRVEFVGSLAGVGFLAVYLAFPQRIPPLFGLVAALVVAICAVMVFDSRHDMAVGFAASAVSACAAVLTWRRSRNLLASLVLLAPSVAVLYKASVVTSGWQYVVLSFLLLGVGAFLSLRDGRTLKG